MAYDPKLAARVTAALSGKGALTEKKMFGGLCYLIDGNMVCGLLEGKLIVRVGAEGHAEALAQPHASVMDFSGRSMQGFVYVAEAGLTTEKRLGAWLARGLAYAQSLPPKGVKPARKSKKGDRFVVAPVRKARRPRPR
jgi:TfoX/Sxy family transcriptional regulator of competence genes